MKRRFALMICIALGAACAPPTPTPAAAIFAARTPVAAVTAIPRPATSTVVPSVAPVPKPPASTSTPNPTRQPTATPPPLVNAELGDSNQSGGLGLSVRNWRGLHGLPDSNNELHYSASQRAPGNRLRISVTETDHVNSVTRTWTEGTSTTLAAARLVAQGLMPTDVRQIATHDAKIYRSGADPWVADVFMSDWLCTRISPRLGYWDAFPALNLAADVPCSFYVAYRVPTKLGAALVTEILIGLGTMALNWIAFDRAKLSQP